MRGYTNMNCRVTKSNQTTVTSLSFDTIPKCTLHLNYTISHPNLRPVKATRYVSATETIRRHYEAGFWGCRQILTVPSALAVNISPASLG